LRKQEVSGCALTVVRDDLRRRFDGDRADVIAAEALRLDEAAQELDRDVRGDMAGIALEADALGLELTAEPPREQRRGHAVAERFEHAVTAFEHVARPFVAALREPRRDHAAFGGPAQGQALYHAARARFRRG